MELVNDRKDLSVFASFLANSSVIQELDLETPKTLYTLFVPSDDAFSKNQIKTLQRNETLAENFVRRHIFKGFAWKFSVYFSILFVTSMLYSMLREESVRLTKGYKKGAVVYLLSLKRQADLIQKKISL